MQISTPKNAYKLPSRLDRNVFDIQTWPGRGWTKTCSYHRKSLARRAKCKTKNIIALCRCDSRAQCEISSWRPEHFGGWLIWCWFFMFLFCVIYLHIHTYILWSNMQMCKRQTKIGDTYRIQ